MNHPIEQRGMVFDPTETQNVVQAKVLTSDFIKLWSKMSWLWKDKKTEQLKLILTKAEEDDKNNTIQKLTTLRLECQDFKSHLDKTFNNARVTESK